MDQYVLWHLHAEDLSLDVIWAKYENFCKPQTNEVRDSFDLLTCFIQGNHPVDECYNAVQAQLFFCQVPTRNCMYFCIDIFSGISLKMRSLFPKTINDSNIDLETFPASKVRQCAKKMESSKSTTRCIK